MADDLRSDRRSLRVERLYALIIQDESGEGVVRRETPAGPQAFITDDPLLADALLSYVRQHHFPKARVVAFQRQG